MKLILLLIIIACNCNTYAEEIVFTCTHPEICKLLSTIIKESKLSNLHYTNAILPTGDPHEYEPNSKEIKELIKAQIIINGPKELNPWTDKIEKLRNHNQDIYIYLDKNLAKHYPGASTESLSHFWLYPDFYCSFKEILENELKKKNIKIKSSICETQNIQKKLENTLANITIPIIVTHDALVPLLKKARKNSHDIVAIKGSTHHEEASVNSIKKVYDLLKNPKVLWIIENNIVIPSNISSKIRPNDLIIRLDTKSKLDTESFDQLNQLINEFNKIKNQ